ncbi:MAG TPA: hypothetical protein VM450_15145 [Thermomicrobiales bacterium]|nr:hypothetical protein [Thermomicrobiales bacterium]
MTRPKVAVITTVYFPDSHADVVATRLIKGYEFQGQHVEPRVEVVSMYLEQIADNDIGVGIADEYGVPRYPTVAEAITRGGTGVNVDGVVIIGEHGDFEYNEYEQKLYPRRRLFDAAVSTMIAAGRMVPIFNDKHLAWSFRDAQAIYETTQRLGIPFLAGSTIPLAWRIPTATEWPLGEPMTEIVIAGYGPTEVYGYHILEGLQVHAERRAGGETGVVAVTGLSGDDAKRAVNDGTVNADLLDKALRTFDLTDEEREQARQSAKDVFLVEYADGLRAAVVNCDEVIKNFGAAAVGPNHEMAVQIWLQGYPHGHFIFLTRQLESMILNGVAPYPVERTYLTTGILDVAMRSRHAGGERRETPELAISYQIPERIPDTGVYDPLPEPATVAGS